MTNLNLNSINLFHNLNDFHIEKLMPDIKTMSINFSTVKPSILFRNLFWFRSSGIQKGKMIKRKKRFQRKNENLKAYN